MPSPPPRPRIEDESASLDMKALSDSIKAALTTATKEDTGSFIAKEEAALVQRDLSLASRAGFVAMLRNKSALVDERVHQLFSLENGSNKEATPSSSSASRASTSAWPRTGIAHPIRSRQAWLADRSALATCASSTPLFSSVQASTNLSAQWVVPVRMANASRRRRRASADTVAAGCMHK